VLVRGRLKGQIMKSTSCVMLVMMWLTVAFANAKDGAVPSTSSSMVPITGIVGATVEEDGVKAVVTARSSEPNRQHFLLVRFKDDGTPAENIVIGADDALQLGHKTIVYQSQFGLGWIQPGKGIMFTSVKQGTPNTITLLPDEPMEGTPVDFWIVETKGQTRLFVVRSRFVNPDGKGVSMFDVNPDGKGVTGGKQYQWVYSYAIGKNGPTLAGKTCVQDPNSRPCDVVCGASGGDGVVIWQSILDREHPFQIVRYAQWKDAGTLDWKNRYAGNYYIGLLVDTSCGMVCLVNEWKSPIDASGISCFVRTGGTEVVPVGAYGEKDRSQYVQLVRLVDLGLWAVVSKGKKGVTITVVDDECVPSSRVQVDGDKIAECFLTTRQGVAYLILREQGRLSCRKISVKSTRP
jgi:hypothetical protein